MSKNRNYRQTELGDIIFPRIVRYLYPTQPILASLMKLFHRSVFLLFLLFSFQGTYAQELVGGRWRDYLSLSDSRDVVFTGSKVWVAASRGLYQFDPEDESLTKKTKLNGLSDINVTALAHDPSTGYLLVGYENGNIDIIDGSDVLNLTDIKRSPQYSGKKNVNQIIVHDGRAHFCTDFGVVVVDLQRLLVLETWIIGPGGSQLEVLDLEFHDSRDTVYAATPSGLFRASMGTSLAFFGNWALEDKLPSTLTTQVELFNDRIFISRYSLSSNDDTIYQYSSGSWNVQPVSGLGRVFDLTRSGGKLLVAKNFNVLRIGAGFTEDLNISQALFAPGEYSPGAVTFDPGRGWIFIADQGYGLYRVRDDILGVRNYTPDGPFSNRSFKLTNTVGGLWIAAGSVTDGIWGSEFIADGAMNLRGQDWTHIGSEDINNARDILDVLPDPTDPDRVFMASWTKGLVEVKDGALVSTYGPNETNGAIQGVSGSANDVRLGGLAFDGNGTLWMTNSLVPNNLVSLSRNGSWTNYGLGSAGGTSLAVKRIKVTSLGQKWMQTRNAGIVVFDQSAVGSPVSTLKKGVGSGNLPTDAVNDFDEDIDGEVWIGTDEGLVVLYNPANLFRFGATKDAQPILFEEEGVVQKLLGDQPVTAIEVDGANKKWIGTRSSGVFYLSGDGLETIHHFTSETSPLISNTILDIEIDDITGEVFFATPLGVVSFKGAATIGYDDYTDVFAYPNPVEPGYEGPIAIKGLVTNARVKITDVEGNLVFETIAEGGQAFWYGTNLNGVRVASGVYLAYITNDDGSLTHVTKIVVVR